MKHSDVKQSYGPRLTTMLELVQSLARQEIPEHEIVSTVLELVESGRVILVGNFRGIALRDRDDEPT
jgi:hypothetical protein